MQIQSTHRFLFCMLFVAALISCCNQGNVGAPDLDVSPNHDTQVGPLDTIDPRPDDIMYDDILEMCGLQKVVCQGRGPNAASDPFVFYAASDPVTCYVDNLYGNEIAWVVVLGEPQLLEVSGGIPFKEFTSRRWPGGPSEGGSICTPANRPIQLNARFSGDVELRSNVPAGGPCQADAKLTFISEFDYEIVALWSAPGTADARELPEVELHVLAEGGCWNSVESDCNIRSPSCEFESGARATHAQEFSGSFGMETVRAQAYDGDYQIALHLPPNEMNTALDVLVFVGVDGVWYSAEPLLLQNADATTNSWVLVGSLPEEASKPVWQQERFESVPACE